MRQTQHDNPRRKQAAGITLVETVLSLLILGGAFVAALNTIASARGAQAIVTQRQLGLALAEGLMAEVLSMPAYQEDASIGPELDERATSDRSLFDDVDDFDGWSSSPPVDFAGETIAGAEGYSRAVEVVYVELWNPTATTIIDEGVVRITVTVKWGDKTVAELVAYRTDLWQAPQELY